MKEHDFCPLDIPGIAIPGIPGSRGYPSSLSRRSAPLRNSTPPPPPEASLA
jgi:hypothetical protein